MNLPILTEATLDETGFGHDRLTVNGVNLHYVRGGSGTPVLLWHGFLETWYCWRKVMPALAGRYTVIAPDMRGYGDSDKPPEGYDARTLAEDFHQLMARLGFTQIHLVAHDMGAPPALLYAAEYPGEVLSLTYLEEPVLLAETLQPLFTFSPHTLQHGGLWWWSFALVPELPQQLLAGREREFITWFYQHYCYDPASVEEAAIAEYLRTFAAAGGVQGAFGVYRAVFATIEQTAPLARRKLSLPVLALGGEKVQGEHVKEMMGHVALHVQGGALSRCGHFIPDEQPEALLEQLLAFFAGAENQTDKYFLNPHLT
jgi:pimeloyl-ACP methyl ester carboxylesterase